ncbi:MAG: DUF2723 domain-containing protein [Chloroflexi bacterium]|nr:DUF2723 domain-containing protein [Chloroflexota bacterium]
MTRQPTSISSPPGVTPTWARIFIRRTSVNPAFRAFLVFILVLMVFSTTLAGEMLAGDSGEFQLAVATLSVPHPTGYPLYVLIGALWVRLWFFLTPAAALNLLSAVYGAAAAAVIFLTARRYARSDALAAAACFLFALAPAFWSQSSVAEVYSLGALFLALASYLMFDLARDLVQASASRRRGRFVLLLFVVGLSLAHHRTTVLLLPALLLTVWMVRQSLPDDWQSRLAFGARITAVALLPQTLYAYVFLRLLPQGIPANEVFWNTVMGRTFAGSLGRQVRWVEVLWRIPERQLGVASLALALVGLGLMTRVRASRWFAVLLLAIGVANLAFALVYWVPDVEVFAIPTIVVLALGLGGLGLWIIRLPKPWRLVATTFVLGLSLVPLSHRRLVLGEVVALERGIEGQARGLAAQVAENDAMVQSKWETATAVRYLQAVEGLRRDLEIVPIHLNVKAEYDRLLAAINGGRTVYVYTGPGAMVSRFPASYAFQEVSPGLEKVSLNSPHVFTFPRGFGWTMVMVGFWVRGDVLSLYWLPQSGVTQDFSTFAHFFNAAGESLGQADKAPYDEAIYTFPPTRWVPNILIQDRFRLPKGTAYARVGAYVQRGSSLANLGEPVLLPIYLAEPSLAAHQSDVAFDNGLRLLGYDLAGTEGQSGEVTLTLRWWAEGKLDRDYTVFVHLLDASGRLIAQKDTYPVGGLLPTSTWPPATVVLDGYRLPRPPDLARIIAEVYDWRTLVRSKTAAGADHVVVWQR